jgi:hypothetical protein
MENRIEEIITSKTKDLLENTYYNDISRDDVWNQLILDFISDHAELTSQIESLADNGIANVRRLASLCLHYLPVVQNIFTTTKESNDTQVLQFYLILLCYFHNCRIIKNNTFLKDIPINEKIAFFYQADLDGVLQTICNEFKINTDLFSNEIDAVTILRELLVLPFLIENIESKDIKDLDTLRTTIKQDNNVDASAFSWLKGDSSINSFAHDLINTIRAFIFIKKIYLSCGAKKMYGYQQRLIDKQSGNVLYSIPYKTQMFLLKGTSALVTGQANIDNIEVLPNGDLLVVFKYGLFFDDAITDQAAFNTALAIHDYLLPCFSIFKLNILLESPHENPIFSEKVKEQLNYLSPETATTIKVLPPLKIAPKIEKDRYLAEKDIVLSEELKNQIINNIRSAGYKSNFMVPDFAFQNVKLIELMPPTVLCEEGNPSEFVYIPFTEGLTGHSVEEGVSFKSKPWAPVGHIGAIQNSLRTATVTVEKKVKLLMIPANIYLRYWHIDYTVDELGQRIREFK